MNDVKRDKDNPQNSKNILDRFILIDEAMDLSIQ
jgi:hypothetical protein